MAKKDELVSRVSISLTPKLLARYDQMAAQKGYDNRSLAIADMMRGQLVEHRQKLGNTEIAGTITLVYDHHTHHVQKALTGLQHDHHALIISTMHVHLDHHNCLEVLVVKGKARAVETVADKLISAKDVKHGKLTVTSTGKDLPV
jgi:CopG family transcriptional regulator, nickel-responsive regulator